MVGAPEPTLSLHVTESGSVTTDCGLSIVGGGRCSFIVVEGTPGMATRVHVVASNVEPILGIRFGLVYGPEIVVESWNLCVDGTELATDDWPASGSALALALDGPAAPGGPDEMVVVGYFELANPSAGVFAVTPDIRAGVAEYVDEDLRTYEFDPLDLGRADISGDGLGFTACGVDDVPDTPDVPGGEPDSLDLSHVVAMFVEGAIQFPPGVAASAPEDATIEADLDSILADYDVVEVARAYPDFTETDRHAVSRTGEVVQLTDRSRIFFIDIPEGDDPEPLAEALRQLPFTYFVETDEPGQPAGERCAPGTIPPCDPLFDQQWSLRNTGQTICDGTAGTLRADVAATAAWTIETGSPNVWIAVFDGGVTNDHEDLAGRVLPPAPSGPSDPTVNEDAGSSWHGHGFLVSGIIAAQPNNGVGLTGIDWSAMILSRRIDPAGAINSFYCSHPSVRLSQACQVIDAVQRGAQIGNHSWITTGQRPPHTLGVALRDTYMLNTVTFGALPNEGNAALYFPGAFDLVISVGQTDADDELVGECRPYMDLAAPGAVIPTTEGVGCAPGSSSCTEYRCTGGTSVATPLCAGIAGLLLSERPDLYNDDVRGILLESADDRTQPGDCTGVLRVNARQALSRLQDPYQLIRGSATGGTVTRSDAVELTLFGEPYKSCTAGGCPSQSWSAIRKRVEKTIAFPTELDGDVKAVWGRGAASVGYNDEDVNYAAGWCDLVAGSIDEDAETFQLVTYVYELYDEDDTLVDTVPAEPAGVQYAYTLLGKRDVVAVPDLTLEEPMLSCLQPVSSRPSFRLGAAADQEVTLNVFDANGRLVRRLLQGRVGDVRVVHWDGRELSGEWSASGVYFAQLVTGRGAAMTRVVLLR